MPPQKATITQRAAVNDPVVSRRAPRTSGLSAPIV
jgi:hypothetical protein